MNEIKLTTKALNQLHFNTGIVGRVTEYAPLIGVNSDNNALIQFDNTETPYVNEDLGERLREAKINYLDKVGNAYLNVSPIFVLIQGKSPKDKVASDKASRLFTENGQKVIFALLLPIVRTFQ